MALDLIKCAFCGKAFVDADGQRPVCKDCRGSEDKLYKKIRSMIRDNPERPYSVAEVAQIFGVAEATVNYFVDYGLLQLARGNRLAEVEAIREFLRTER
jgi:hypothetical protein